MSRADGIVIESGRGWALIMSRDGRYRKIKTNQALYPGEYYHALHRPALRYGIAAAVLLLLLAGTADFFNVVAYASVSPGIDLGINRWDRVVAVKTDSDEAAQMAAQLDVSGKTSSEAVATLVSQIIENNQLPEGTAGKLNITVHSKNNDQALGAQYQENLVAKISLSVDEVLQVHDQVKIKHDAVGEKVSIHYKAIPPGIAKKSQDTQENIPDSAKTNGSAMKNDDTENYQAGKKPEAAIPANKSNAGQAKVEGLNSVSEAAPSIEEPGLKNLKFKNGFTQWLENKSQIDWPGFRSMIKPGQEKKDK